ncbi:MAG: histidine kinase [Pseudomonadota bacterium]|nr:histidine kinase [Pseudomonadota bacterium]
MPRRLRTSGNGWLVSHSEAAVYGCAVFAFWSYTTLTRVLVRALWYQAMPSANMTSPGVFALVHVIFAPALLIAHSAAYKIGFPDLHRASAAAKHFLIVLFVLLMARMSFLAISVYLMRASQASEIWGDLREWLADPLSGLGSAVELASLYCVGLALAAGVVNWRRYHLEAIASAELALDVERSRSMALRRQLDPHSLYNTLNAIAGSVRTAPTIAIRMLGSLGELLRLTLRDEVVESNVADEFAIAEKYLTLYQLRYPDKLSIRVELAECCRDVAIPPLLLQPLVENAAMHGVDAGCSAVEVRLQGAGMTAERIQITISNTCAPTAVLVPPALSSGIGLRNTWQRLKLFYGNDFSLEWMPNGRNTATLKLEIPRVIPKSLSEPTRSDAGDVLASISVPHS